MTTPEQDPSGKILWLCRENIGRSQVAQTFWNINYADTSISAGFDVDDPGSLLANRPEADTLIKVMADEYGMDIAKNNRSSIVGLSKEILRRARMIVVLAEPSVIPFDFHELGNVEFWEVQDMKGKSYKETNRIVEEIKLGIPKIRTLLS